jgi:hypothetical protein
LEGFIQNDPTYLSTDSPDFFDVRKFGPVFLPTTVFKPSRPQAVLLVEILGKDNSGDNVCNFHNTTGTKKNGPNQTMENIRKKEPNHGTLTYFIIRLDKDKDKDKDKDWA